MKAKFKRFTLCLAILSLLLGTSFYLGYRHKPDHADTSVFFSPRGGCTAEIARNIGLARSTILVQAYSFTSVPIAKALTEARDRGVAIQIILDDSQLTERYSSATFCSNAGIPTFIDSKHSIAHNKIMVIDDATVLTGSFNYSKAAEESNAENLLVIRNASLALLYRQNWEKHLAHSAKYAKKQAP